MCTPGAGVRNSGGQVVVGQRNLDGAHREGKSRVAVDDVHVDRNAHGAIVVGCLLLAVCLA